MQLEDILIADNLLIHFLPEESETETNIHWDESP